MGGGGSGIGGRGWRRVGSGRVGDRGRSWGAGRDRGRGWGRIGERGGGGGVGVGGRSRRKCKTKLLDRTRQKIMTCTPISHKEKVWESRKKYF